MIQPSLQTCPLHSVGMAQPDKWSCLKAQNAAWLAGSNGSEKAPMTLTAYQQKSSSSSPSLFMVSTAHIVTAWIHRHQTSLHQYSSVSVSKHCSPLQDTAQFAGRLQVRSFTAEPVVRLPCWAGLLPLALGCGRGLQGQNPGQGDAASYRQAQARCHCLTLQQRCARLRTTAAGPCIWSKETPHPAGKLGLAVIASCFSSNGLGCEQGLQGQNCMLSKQTLHHAGKLKLAVIASYSSSNVLGCRRGLQGQIRISSKGTLCHAGKLKLAVIVLQSSSNMLGCQRGLQGQNWISSNKMPRHAGKLKLAAIASHSSNVPGCKQGLHGQS